MVAFLKRNIVSIAAEKASIYTYPGAVLPILNPLMKVLAYLFPDEGIKKVGSWAMRCCLTLLTLLSGLDMPYSSRMRFLVLFTVDHFSTYSSVF